MPAVTRQEFGRGTAWYVATRLDRDATDGPPATICAAASVGPTRGGRPVEPRGGPAACAVGHDVRLLCNHGDAVEVGITGHDLVAGIDRRDGVVVPAGGIRVIREA